MRADGLMNVADKMAPATGRAHSMRTITRMTTPAAPTQTLDAATIAELNDLLELDHDALASYALTMRELQNATYRDTVSRYRRDHERHADELTALIGKYGGQPIAAPHPSSLDKLAMQAIGDIGGGDTPVLVAFRANERQARDKYARAAERAGAWPSDVQTFVHGAARDEQRHYDWADMTVQALGVSDDSAVGKVARGIETFHARTHDGAEAVEKQAARGFEAARRAVPVERFTDLIGQRPFASALVAVGVGLLVAGVRRR